MSRFIMLAGPAASGKTTYAQKLIDADLSDFPRAVVVSSDAIRKKLYGDESDQTDPQKVFAHAHEMIFEYMRDGKDVIFDATNLVPRWRVAPIDIAYRCGIATQRELHYLTTPIGTCLMRNASRERQVPTEVISRQVLQRRQDLNRALGAFHDEGFNVVKFI